MKKDELRLHLKGSITFLFYRASNFWYTTETGFKFPIPAEDVQDGTMLAKDTALPYLRYIRKHYDRVTPSNS